jgi:hypothetical protein
MSAIKRSVRFSAKDNHNVGFEYEVLDAAKLDRSIFYLDRSDYKRMHAENHATMQMMRTGSLDTDYFCSRGLESRTKYAARRRIDWIRRAQKAVIDEHWQQIDNGCNDPKIIEELYKEFALPALAQAQRVAARDASAAKKCHACPPGVKKNNGTGSFPEEKSQQLSSLSPEEVTESTTERKSLSLDDNGIIFFKSSVRDFSPMKPARKRYSSSRYCS